jgi:hypothetical protein
MMLLFLYEIFAATLKWAMFLHCTEQALWQATSNICVHLNLKV